MESPRPAKLTLNGRPVLKTSEVDWSIKSNDSPIYTLDEGLSGFADGAEEFDLTMKQAIPSSGYQIDWMGLARTHTTIRPGLIYAGKAYALEGRVMEASGSSKVNDPGMVNVTIKARITAVTNVSL